MAQSRAARQGRPSSVKKINAAGSAKRQLRTAKAKVTDVYEHQQQKVRRDKVKLALDHDEIIDYGGADSDEEAAGREALRARLIGEHVDNERLDSDDDEEIDSDAAFESGDEEQFAGFTFRKNIDLKAASNRKISQRRDAIDVDLNEDDTRSDALQEENSTEGEDDDDSGEFLDLLDILDGRGDDRTEARNAADHARPSAEGRQEDISDSGEEESSSGTDEEGDDESEENQSISLSVNDEDLDEDAVDGLAKFVSALDTKKRKAEEDPAPESHVHRKRRVLAERTQAGLEGEFSAHTGSTKLNLEDLVTPLAPSSEHVLSLKKSAKTLASTKLGKTLSAPLPTRHQERLEREAAYEQTKAEVNKWNNAMKQIREEQHLSFPLQAERPGKGSTLELTAKFKPVTALETSVDALLRKAHMREQDLAQTEELKMNHVSAEEVATRRAEVRKMRELMYRAEVKAKRIAKIKSKTYHRIKKKERKRLAELAGDEDLSEDDEARLKREAERAKERATLRHKNTGKWAKAMRRRGELDEDQQQDVLDMLDRGEKLRKRIQGHKVSDESDDSSDGDDDEMDEDALKAKAFKELDELRGDGTPAAFGGKSVFDMKFMRDAAAREQRIVDKQVDDFSEVLHGLESHNNGRGDDSSVTRTTSTTVERVGGRMSFRPGPESAQVLPTSTSQLSHAPSDTSSTTLKSTETTAHVVPVPTPISHLLKAPNPWLVSRDTGRSSTLKRSEIAIGKGSSAAVKSKDKLNKARMQLESERAKAQDDAALDISTSDILNIRAVTSHDHSSTAVAQSVSRSNKRDAKEMLSMDDRDTGSDYNSEVDEQERQSGRKMKSGNTPLAFEQRDLVALAFAGDNVVQEFEATKQAEINTDAPKEIDTTLPGWGSWGGAGIRKKAPKPHLIKKVAGVDPKSRADHGKAHVIISEKRDKKAAKYLVRDLPYPYKSKAEYERTLSTPIGTEWNTRVAFQRATLPKVTKKMGVVINPLQKT